MSTFLKPLKLHEQYFKQHGELLLYKKGQHLVWPADTYPWVYFLVLGHVRVCFRINDATSRIIGFFIPGSTFAQSGSFFADDGGGLQYIAETPVQVLRVSRSAFLSQLDNDAAFNKEYLDSILRHQIFLIDRIVYQGEPGIEKKFARWLLFMCKYYSDSTKSPIKISLPLSQNTIADFLHITRESANAVIRDFTKKGLVSVQDQYLHVHDKTAIQKLLTKR